MTLLPQRFVLPPSGTPHSSRVNHGVFGKKFFDVLNESVSRIDSIEPVGNVAEMGVKFKGVYVSVRNPRHRRLTRQLRHNRKTTVPNAGMVSTLVSQDGDAGQPTAQDKMLRQSEILCHLVFCRMVRKVGIEL